MPRAELLIISNFKYEKAAHLDAWLQNKVTGRNELHGTKPGTARNPALLVENAKSKRKLYSFTAIRRNNGWTKHHLTWFRPMPVSHDYHDVIRGKLNVLIQKLKDQVPGIAIRGFVDSAPVLEEPGQPGWAGVDW
ncbi:MAG: QueG-associated DUF1730 domain-containing protein [Bacteroidales bacterium]